ncbi:MAG: hypothetical protein KDC24_08040 [Saprospiraceae bacterium]|nr:hypothetical protein [Saprospiraceae bacterium]
MQNYSQKKIIRNQHWDYSWDGVYLITICTEDRTHEFGFIEDGEMYLNEKGLAVYLLWYELENHFESCLLDQFVIMPNHIHGLIILDHKNAPQIKSKKIENVIEGMAVGGVQNGISF